MLRTKAEFGNPMMVAMKTNVPTGLMNVRPNVPTRAAACRNAREPALRSDKSVIKTAPKSPVEAPLGVKYSTAEAKCHLGDSRWPIQS